MTPNYKTKHSRDTWDWAMDALALERQFEENLYNGSLTNRAALEIRGKNPIVISSPHAVNHPRENEVKLADTFTGALALQLSSITASSALIYARKTEEDPNYDADGPFKQQLITLVRQVGARCVIDLHGLGRSQPFQIVIGTAHGQTLGQRMDLRDSVVDTLREHGFTQIAIDVPGFYDASRPSTISSYVWRTANVPAIQIEINKDFRDPKTFPGKYSDLVKVLQACIEKLGS